MTNKTTTWPNKTVTWIGLAVAGSLATVLTLSTVHTQKVSAAHITSPIYASFSTGNVSLQSAGRLAFGPDGMLFVADSLGGSITAIDTGDTRAAKAAPQVNIEGIDAKIAALAGVTPDQIIINDIKVNPVSKNVYLSGSRGRGPDALPLIVKVESSDKLTLVPLDNIKHVSVSLTDAPASDSKARQDPRVLTITDLAYVNGNLLVAGMSNEEWSSALRSIPYPFVAASAGATLQIWHSSHGRYETQAPIRTFVPYKIAGTDYILAAYTCTPLVKIPVSDLKPGAQVKGVTIADLGAGNQPLDMVPYQKDGHNFVLVANSSRGVMKLKADNLQSYAPIDSPTVTGVAGVHYDTLSDLKNVQHLARVDAGNALILSGTTAAGTANPRSPVVGPFNLRTIALP